MRKYFTEQQKGILFNKLFYQNILLRSFGGFSSQKKSILLSMSEFIDERVNFIHHNLIPFQEICSSSRRSYLFINVIGVLSITPLCSSR